MTKIIDKRFLPKNQISGSRQKFIDRYKNSIKSRIKDILDKSSIKDLTKSEKKVKIKKGNLNEPEFQFEVGTGNTDRIYIGNKTFKKGQKLKRNSGGNGGAGKGGPNGDGSEDDFEFVLTEKEFSDLLFEDLALPELTKKELIGTNYEIQHAGYSRSGGPTSLNIKKTMLNSIGRRAALKNRENRKKYIDELVEELRPKKKIQYIEDLDLRYNFKDKIDVPSAKAVMFCLMDVSGSMDEKAKDMSKRFYLLLNLFLKRNYKVVDVVFVRHAEHAEEVTEDVFFHDRISGGTIVSTGYDEILSIIKDRYQPEQWNIYIAQSSDGDNWPQDNEEMEDKLVKYLLPQCQYFAYIDVASGLSMASYYGEEHNSDVLDIMKRLMGSNKNLQARRVEDYHEIFPVFRSLFKKEG